MRFTYSAIEIQQRVHVYAPRLLLFAAPAGEISKWAEVARLSHIGEGHQRRRNESKVRAISKFLASDDRNTIPSALTIALSDATIEESESDCKTITIASLDDGGGSLIIDGQHRLYGVEKFDPCMRLNIVAIVDPDDLEIAFQFLVVNNKASKVPTDHYRLLANLTSDEKLSSRLRAARLSLNKNTALISIVDLEDSSPFFKSVIWPVDDDEDSRSDFVRPAAIEVSLAQIERKDLNGLGNEDALIDFFFAIWNAVKDIWPDLWTEESRLLSKAGLVAMTNFLLEDLTPFIDRGRLDASDPDAVSTEVSNILSSLEEDFWTADWTRSSLDTTAGRQLIVESLQKVRRNRSRGEPWYSGVTLISTSSLSSFDNQ